MKHAGQKSVKDKLPEQRKGPKRAVECWLKVQTHVWEQPHEGSNPSRCATSEEAAHCLLRLILINQSAHMLLRFFTGPAAPRSGLGWT